MTTDAADDEPPDAYALEAPVGGTRLDRLEWRVDRIERLLVRLGKKLDKVLALFAAGKGAVWVLTRLGALALLILAGFGWLADHLHWWQK